MPASAKDMLRVRLQSVQTSISRLPHSQRSGQVSIPLAENFNSILSDVAAQYPDLVSALPKPISTRGSFGSLGVTDAQLVDLDAFCEQIIGLLTLTEN